MDFTLKQVRRQNNLSQMYDLTKSYTYGWEEEGIPIISDEGSSITNENGCYKCSRF